MQTIFSMVLSIYTFFVATELYKKEYSEKS